jgi:PAS domain S-box-containing protein
VSTSVLLFLGSVACYSLLPLLFALLPERYRYLLLYSHIAGVLVLGGLLGAVYVLPITGDVALLAGQVSYGALLFSTLVTAVVGSDVRVIRNVFVLVVAIDVLKYVVFRISHEALTRPGVPNPLGTSPELFDQSLRVVVFGGLLILVELVILLALLELAKRRLSSWAMAPVYVLSYVAVVTLDGVLFPTLVLMPSDGLGDAIRAGVQAKLVLAGAFAVPLAAFVALYRPSVARFEETPINLVGILSMSPEQLLVSLDRQQDELEQERQRLLSTQRRAGRASATVDGILEATVSTVLVATDADLRVTHVNPGTRTVLGYTEEELVGGTPTHLFGLDALAAMRGDESLVDAVRILADRGERRDWTVRHRDGRELTLAVGVSVIEVEDEVVGFLFAGDDVTARVRAEHAFAEALRREQEAGSRLHEIDRLKHDLVTTMSHELRTPLTTIRGSGALLLEDPSLEERQRRGVERILRSTERLGSLVDDLLTLAESDDPGLAFDPQPLDLRQVPVGPAGLLAEIASGRGVELVLDLPDEPVACWGDFSALERVAAHLLSNGVKFNRDGGEVRVRVAATDVRARLEVSDTGRGIEEADRQRLFEPFERGPEVQAAAIQGAGLGLPLVAEVVARHGGSVGFDSEPGRGTTVVVELPAHPPTG